jgi:hypothetical protein
MSLQYNPDVFALPPSVQQSDGKPKDFVKRIIVCCDGYDNHLHISLNAFLDNTIQDLAGWSRYHESVEVHQYPRKRHCSLSA